MCEAGFEPGLFYFMQKRADNSPTFLREYTYLIASNTPRNVR